MGRDGPEGGVLIVESRGRKSKEGLQATLSDGAAMAATVLSSFL